MSLAGRSETVAEPLAIELREASQWVSLPPAIHFQRRANEWLLALRKAAFANGLLPLVCGRAKLDIFDALRSSLNLANGSALSDLCVARAALATFPDRELLFSEEKMGSDFLDSIIGLADSTPRLRVERRGNNAHRWATLRSRVHAIRSEAARRLGLVLTSSRLPSGAKVLAIPRLPGHFSDIVPVARVLRKSHGIETVFGVVDREMQTLVAAENFPAVPLRGSSSREFQRLLGSHDKFAERLASFFVGQALKFDLLEAEETQLLIASTQRILRGQLSYLLDVAVSSASVTERLRPTAILVGNPYTLEGRIAALIGRDYGVPAVAIEHGSIFPNDPIWQECAVDLVCTWGRPSQRALLTCGVREDQIAITGGPRFDTVFAAADQLHGTNGVVRDWILVATSGPGDQVSLSQHEKFIRALNGAAELAPEIKWLVKLHKKDREELYQHQGQATHPRVELVRGQRTRDGLEIFDYLRRARGALTICSSSALDAMAVNVPVISVDVWSPAPALQGVEFLERDCTRRVCGPEQLAEAARAVWRGESHPSDAAAAAYAAMHFVNRGNASNAVAGEILKLMERPAGGA